MTDLDKLIEAVEGGVRLPMDGSAYRLFGDAWIHVFDAYNGSLDAAKALHEALTPDWSIDYFHLSGEVGLRKYNPRLATFGDGGSENPARAWLIAILKAYKSQQEANQ